MYEKTKNVFRQRFLRFRAVTTKTKKISEFGAHRS
jgi:hypothetical protein